MSARYAVIMAGGRGERFWPQSRLHRPKQLLPIVGGKPMIAQTVERLAGLVPPERIFIITNQEQRAGTVAACPGVPASQIVGEPVGRDTAAAVGLAVMLVSRLDPNASLALLPADAAIHDDTGFRRALESAFTVSERAERLVTVGISPTGPATGYGYIHKGERDVDAAGLPVFSVRRFVEKPDLEKARSYVASGEFLWNAGMFVWSVPTIVAAFEKNASDIWSALKSVGVSLDHGKSLDATLREIYPLIPKISVDYAILEKATNVSCVPAVFDWDDVGEWPAIARHDKPDASGNILRGDSLVLEGRENIVISEAGHLVAVLGVDDLVVVHTPDATLVIPKARAQDVKKLVQHIAMRPDWKSRV